jgi:uncharacterized protein with PQ loop repeat
MFSNISANVIGHISLNISFFFYLSLLAPQLVHNWKHRSTQHLSLGMHYVMCICYVADLCYGFGRHMQWQYKTVTLVGIFCLIVQHIQIYRYSAFNPQQRQQYQFYTVGLLILLMSAIYILVATVIPSRVFIWGGGIAQIGWLIYVIPQIVKNHKIKSTAGVSLYFVLLLIFLALCDSISAWCLGWDWPSRYGAALGIIIRLILLYQFFRYHTEATVLNPSHDR